MVGGQLSYKVEIESPLPLDRVRLGADVDRDLDMGTDGGVSRGEVEAILDDSELLPVLVVIDNDWGGWGGECNDSRWDLDCWGSF